MLWTWVSVVLFSMVKMQLSRGPPRRPLAERMRETRLYIILQLGCT